MATSRLQCSSRRLLAESGHVARACEPFPHGASHSPYFLNPPAPTRAPRPARPSFEPRKGRQIGACSLVTGNSRFVQKCVVVEAFQIKPSPRQNSPARKRCPKVGVQVHARRPAARDGARLNASRNTSPGPERRPLMRAGWSRQVKDPIAVRRGCAGCSSRRRNLWKLLRSSWSIQSRRASETPSTGHNGEPRSRLTPRRSAGFDLEILMRALFGRGTPKEAAGITNALVSVIQSDVALALAILAVIDGTPSMPVIIIAPETH